MKNNVNMLDLCIKKLKDIDSLFFEQSGQERAVFFFESERKISLTILSFSNRLLFNVIMPVEVEKEDIEKIHESIFKTPLNTFDHPQASSRTVTINCFFSNCSSDADLEEYVLGFVKNVVTFIQKMYELLDPDSVFDLHLRNDAINVTVTENIIEDIETVNTVADSLEQEKKREAEKAEEVFNSIILKKDDNIMDSDDYVKQESTDKDIVSDKVDKQESADKSMECSMKNFKLSPEEIEEMKLNAQNTAYNEYYNEYYNKFKQEYPMEALRHSELQKQFLQVIDAKNQNLEYKKRTLEYKEQCFEKRLEALGKKEASYQQDIKIQYENESEKLKLEYQEKEAALQKTQEELNGLSEELNAKQQDLDRSYEVLATERKEVEIVKATLALEQQNLEEQKRNIEDLRNTVETLFVQNVDGNELETAKKQIETLEAENSLKDNLISELHANLKEQADELAELHKEKDGHSQESDMRDLMQLMFEQVQKEKNTNAPELQEEIRHLNQIIQEKDAYIAELEGLLAEHPSTSLVANTFDFEKELVELKSHDINMRVSGDENTLVYKGVSVHNPSISYYFNVTRQMLFVKYKVKKPDRFAGKISSWNTEDIMARYPQITYLQYNISEESVTAAAHVRYGLYDVLKLVLTKMEEIK